jgi:nucleotide-binding universal stress UspA family protein
MAAQVPRDAVVVGVDGSSSSAQAAAWAAGQAEREGRPLVVAYGTGPVATLWATQVGLEHQAVTEAMQNDAREMLQPPVDEVTRAFPGLSVHPVGGHSDPRDLLTELSEHARLVVVGSRGNGLVKRILLGSVSGSVARSARCPVVIVRPHSESDHRQGILVGADGHDRSAPTLEFAYRQASLTGAGLTVLHCYLDARVALESGGSGVEPADLDERRVLVSEILSGYGEQYPDVEVSTEFVQGFADAQLVRSAKDADLVVVGRHPKMPVLGRLQGSVAATVAEHADCLVAVVPELGDPDRE